MTPPLNNDQICDLWLGATRYFLGRMTIAVSSFCTTLQQQWPGLPEQVRRLIQRDVEEAFTQDDWQRSMVSGAASLRPYALGMDMDRRYWEQVRELWRKETGNGTPSADHENPGKS